jgi:hypothetical protein
MERDDEAPGVPKRAWIGLCRVARPPELVQVAELDRFYEVLVESARRVRDLSDSWP